jgi:hypothetical protein
VSELEAENGRLKALVAELALDRRTLQEDLKKQRLHRRLENREISSLKFFQ